MAMKIRIDPREGSEFDKAEMSPMIWWQREIKRDSSKALGFKKRGVAREGWLGGRVGGLPLSDQPTPHPRQITEISWVSLHKGYCF